MHFIHSLVAVAKSLMHHEVDHEDHYLLTAYSCWRAKESDHPLFIAFEEIDEEITTLLMRGLIIGLANSLIHSPFTICHAHALIIDDMDLLCHCSILIEISARPILCLLAFVLLVPLWLVVS